MLVYSDDSDVRDQVRQALGDRIHPGLPVLTYIEVATAPVVFQKVLAGRIDLAILDGEATPSGGLGVARQLKDEIAEGPPIVVLIGRTDDAWLAKWSRAEAVVQHPVVAFDLIDAVISALADHPAANRELLAFDSGAVHGRRARHPTERTSTESAPLKESSTEAPRESSIDRSPVEGKHMLNDARLKALFPNLISEPLPHDVDGPQSPVQPASLDLSVGLIHVAGAKSKELGTVESPHTGPYSLQPGHTAVVTTLETLTIPPTHGAIGFPPTTISNNGILMTNPGHVDPGFKGQLTFTVINMGREPFELRRGDRIVTMLFFRLEGGKPDKDYAERRKSSGSAASSNPVTLERMNRLSPDMLDVDRRIKSIVDNAEQKTRRMAIWVPLALAAVVAAGTILAPIYVNLVNQNADLQRRISILEDRKNQDQMQNRLDQLERNPRGPATPPTQGSASGTP